jgi:Predicted Zn-dependent peptidases
MMKIPKIALALALCTSFALAAEPVQGIAGLERFKLANGLEVYAYRDDAVPLARVELVFKAGAIAQGADSAGLFRLCERALLGDAAEPAGINAKLAALGATEWQGGVEAERAAYWFSLPSIKVKEGIALWAAVFDPSTLANASLGEEALARAKTSLIEELHGGIAKPDAIYEAAMNERLFAKYPWRRDPAGSEKDIAAASLDSLKAAAAYFAPNNAALFVGGDIDPEEVRATAEAAFGSWKAGPDPWAKSLAPNPKPGVVRPTWIVCPDPAMPEGVGRIEARYRGPDLATDTASSYAADLWSALVAPSSGRFKSALVKNVPKLQPESISASYSSQRDGGAISLSALFDADEKASAVDRARAFKERARGYEITAMKGESDYFSDDEYEAGRKSLLAAHDADSASADSMIAALAFWWASASIDYYAGYPAAIAKTGRKEVAAFLDSYIMRNLEVIALRMNPADIEREKRSFSGSGFDTVTPANAFWWQKKP